MATLLCPITDFPFMLPECVPVGAILTISSLVPLAVLMHLVRLYQRRRQAQLLGNIQLRGVVTGFGEPGAVVCGPLDDPWHTFRLRCPDDEVLVSPRGARIRTWPRTVCVGHRVTVVGIDGTVLSPGEQLFRQPGSRPGIEAIEISRDRRRLSTLLITAVLLAWLGFVVALLVITRQLAVIDALRVDEQAPHSDPRPTPSPLGLQGLAGVCRTVDDDPPLAGKPEGRGTVIVSYPFLLRPERV